MTGGPTKTRSWCFGGSNATKRGPRRLRELMEGPGPVLAPGAYDALSARLVEGAGFEAV